MAIPEPIETVSWRWVQLAAHCLALFVGGTLCNSFTTIVDVVQELFSVGNVASYVLVIMPAIMNMLLFFMGPYIRNQFGSKEVSISGCFCLFIGAGVRLAAAMSTSFWLMVVGEGLIGAGEVVLLCVVVQLSNEWFAPSQRFSSTTAMVLSTSLGEAFSYSLSPVTAFTMSGMRWLMFSQFMSALTSFMVCVLFMRRLPYRPPSAAAAHERGVHEKLIEQYRDLVTIPGFMLLALSSSLAGGVLTSMIALVNEIMSVEHPGNLLFTGICASLTVLGGLACVPLIISFGSTSTNYKKGLLYSSGLTIASLSLMGYFVGESSIPNGFIYTLFVGIGGLRAFNQVVMQEFQAEIGHPHLPVTSQSILILLIMAFEVVFVLAIADSPVVGSGVVYIGVGISVFAFILLCFVPNDLKRLSLDQKPPEFVTLAGESETEMSYTASSI